MFGFLLNGKLTPEGYLMQKSSLQKNSMYLPTPPHEHYVTQGQFFKWTLTQSFPSPRPVAIARLKRQSALLFLPMTSNRIGGFIPFLSVIELYEMQTASSRSWTRVSVSISYDNFHYITSASKRTVTVKLATVVEGDQKVPFSIATTRYRGVRGVIVIVVGYGHGDSSSIPGRDWLHFT